MVMSERLKSAEPIRPKVRVLDIRDAATQIDEDEA
jgi:hypothetical protein